MPVIRMVELKRSPPPRDVPQVCLNSTGGIHKPIITRFSESCKMIQKTCPSEHCFGKVKCKIVLSCGSYILRLH